MQNTKLLPTDRYYGLDAPPEFWSDLINAPERIKECCNGVGSQVGWLGKLTYHLIPNTIWGLSITEASDIHDWMYVYPKSFATKQDALNWKHMADNLLLDNIITIIERDTYWTLLKIIRRQRAMAYYSAVDEAGVESFLDGKVVSSK
jgi:hypothetical protein